MDNVRPEHRSPSPQGSYTPTAEMEKRTSKPKSDGIGKIISDALSSVRNVITDFADLAALEARRAGLTLMWIVAWGTAAALLAVVSYVGLMGVILLAAVNYGYAVLPTLAILSVANIVFAALIIIGCIRMSKSLTFPATRRQLARTRQAEE